MFGSPVRPWMLAARRGNNEGASSIDALIHDMPVAGLRRATTWLVTLALAATSLVGLAAAPAEAAATFVTPTRIMPMGDSITWGTGGDGGGYRPPLVQSQVVGRYSSDMVGSQRSGPPTLYDRDHEGYRGYRIDQLTALAAGELTAYRPEFVLLQIGTNDVLQQYAGGSGLAGYRVWRATAGSSGPFAAIATTATAPYSDATVASKATYWYRVTPSTARATRASRPASSSPRRNEPVVEALTAGPPSTVRGR
jgi:lysophospholipase L1-like esterase